MAREQTQDVRTDVGLSQESGQVLEIPVRRRRLVGVLAIGLLLAVVSVAWQLAKGRGWQPGSLQLDQALSVDEDLSVLNWLTTSTFLVAAVGALVVAGQQRPGDRRDGRWAWHGAAAALALVSLDEAVGLHGPAQLRAESAVRAGGVPAVALALVGLAVGGTVLWFVFRQEPAVRTRLACSVGLLAVAAVGVDAVGPDLVDDPQARLAGWYVVKSTAEEVLELCAALLTLDAVLLRCTARRLGPLGRVGR